MTQEDNPLPQLTVSDRLAMYLSLFMLFLAYPLVAISARLDGNKMSFNDFMRVVYLDDMVKHEGGWKNLKGLRAVVMMCDFADYLRRDEEEEEE